MDTMLPSDLLISFMQYFHRYEAIKAVSKNLHRCHDKYFNDIPDFSPCRECDCIICTPCNGLCSTCRHPVIKHDRMTLKEYQRNVYQKMRIKKTLFDSGCVLCKSLDATLDGPWSWNGDIILCNCDLPVCTNCWRYRWEMGNFFCPGCDFDIYHWLQAKYDSEYQDLVELLIELDSDSD